MLNEIIRERMLPDVFSCTDVKSWYSRRKEILKLLSEEIYGITPVFNAEIFSFSEERDNKAFAGKASAERIRLSFMTPNGMYSFPFYIILPKNKKPVPAFLYISFNSDILNASFPAEELLDRGYAIANLYYGDITSDSLKVDGIARAYPCDGEKKWGKIGMWAFAASRVMDYLLTRPEIDSTRIAVIGHSRLGKTALWCGAQDERFSMVISNNSGCSGAALHRGKVGENVREITHKFNYWFNEKYPHYAERVEELPFDQHFLLACIAPRALYVGSAQEDQWADPFSEFLSAYEASRIWKLFELEGLVIPDIYPELNFAYQKGRIGYWMREGTHALSREDWHRYMDYREIHHV